MTDTTTPVQTKRAMRTSVFAEYLGDQIADQRNERTIPDVFCAVMREHGVPVRDPDQLSAWANTVSALILADTHFDSETEMAQRAVNTVLRQNFGAELSVSGSSDSRASISETF